MELHITTAQEVATYLQSSTDIHELNIFYMMCIDRLQFLMRLNEGGKSERFPIKDS
jgi:hypothetical protein